MGKVERNAACPCGTEKQYKSRCLQEYEASARAERKAGNSTLAADTDRGRPGSNVSAGSDAGGDRAAGAICVGRNEQTEGVLSRVRSGNSPIIP